MAPKKPNKHTLETYYSELDIATAGSITAGVMLRIYSLLKDKENKKSKSGLISHLNMVCLTYIEIQFFLRIQDFSYLVELF